MLILRNTVLSAGRFYWANKKHSIQRRRTKKSLTAAALVAGVILMAFTTSAPAQVNSTAVGTLSLTPTIECIGAISNYTGDNNQNNNAVLQYRQVGAADWKTAPQMYADRGGSQYRGSIFWLTGNTDYEVKVTFIDADGVSGIPVTATTKTRNDNPPSNGNTYYVATTGSDTYPGTEAQPFKTIQKAADVVAAGATVLIKAGTYSGEVSVTTSGSVNNYITFKNYGSDTPVLNGGFVVKASYIRIKGLTLQNTLSTSILISGENLPAGAVTGVIVEGCTITNPAPGTSDSAIRIDYGAQNSLIQDNHLTVYTTISVEDKNGVYHWRAGDGHVFRRNIIDGTPWDGIGGGPEDTDVTCNNYDFYNNTIIEAWDDGIQMEGGGINTRAWGNRIESSMLGIATAPLRVGPGYIFRNQIWANKTKRGTGNNGMFGHGDGSGGRIYIYHNSYWGMAGSDGPMAKNYGVYNQISRNNIISAGWYVIEFGHDPDGTDCSYDYDILFTTDSGRFIKWGATAQPPFSQQETHGIRAAPQYVDGPGGNFALQSNSPAIDAGVILPGFNDANSPWPYKGSAPDIGAYEYDYGDTTPPAPPRGLGIRQ